MSDKRERLIGLSGAVAVHLVLFAVLGFGISSPREPAQQAGLKPVIQASAVSEEQVMEPYRRRQADKAEQREADAARQRAEEARKQEEAQKKRQAEEEVKREAAERRRQAELKKKQEAEQARLAEQEKQRKIEAERKAEEARKKAEAERQAEEARKKAEAERQAEEARLKAEAEARLKAALAAEDARLAEEAQQRRQARLDTAQKQYVADITNKVQSNWRRLSGSQGSYCRVLIHQIPGGEVVNVRLLECDGDVPFQRSVESAVRKASPLPAPPDPALFEREIEFIFEP